MKNLLLLIITITLTACGSAGDLHGYQPYTVKKIQKNGQFVEEYLIVFHGTEFTAANEVREAWDFRAKNVCQSDYQYLTFKQFELYKKLQAQLLNKIEQCPKKGDVNCIETKKSHGDILTKKHLMVEGIAICI